MSFKVLALSQILVVKPAEQWFQVRVRKKEKPTAIDVEVSPS